MPKRSAHFRKRPRRAENVAEPLPLNPVGPEIGRSMIAIISSTGG